MIVVFCSALTHEALRLTMGAHVCCIMMKLLSQCSERQHGRDFWATFSDGNKSFRHYQESCKSFAAFE